MYADTGDSRSFYEALSTMYGPFHQVQVPLGSSDASTLLIDKDLIRDHLESTLRVSSVTGIWWMSLPWKRSPDKKSDCSWIAH